MKRPITWHLECLNNTRAYAAEEQERIDRMAHRLLEDADKLLEVNTRADALAEQIARAEKEGLDAFDAERFNKRRRK